MVGHPAEEGTLPGQLTKEDSMPPLPPATESTDSTSKGKLPAGSAMLSTSASLTKSTTTTKKTNLKASIYFKFSHDRSRNRTYPGNVNARGRSLLQEWSSQFRSGASSTVIESRRVRATAKRCKLAVITREKAFEWFRKSQEKYALMYLKEDMANAKTEEFDMYPVPPAHVVRFRPSVYMHDDRSDYVEIVWDSVLQFPESPGVWGLNFGESRVPIITLEHGRGAYFNATNLKVGKYVVHGVSFEVQGGSSSSAVRRDTKRKRQSRGKNKSTALCNDIKNAGTDMGKDTLSYFVGKSSDSSPSIHSILASKQSGAVSHPLSLVVANKRKRLENKVSSNETGSCSPFSDTVYTKMEDYWGNTNVHTSSSAYRSSCQYPSKSELRLLKRMREELQDLLVLDVMTPCTEATSNFSLLRFLRGANQNVSRAVEVFRTHVDIRIKYKWHEVRQRVVSSKNFDPLHFTIDDLIFGSFVKDHWKMKTCVGYTQYGDPIAVLSIPESDEWIDILLGKVSENKSELFSIGHQLFTELFVRRQIQLDLLSKRQNRMVCMETIWDFSGGKEGTYWKSFANSDYRRYQKSHNKIVASCPNIQGRVHVLGASWWLRWSCRCLWWITDSLLRQKIILYDGSDSEAYRKIGGLFGTSSLTAIVQSISELRARGRVCFPHAEVDVARLHAAQGLAARDKKDVTKETISIQMNDLARQGDVTIRSGKGHEIMIEVDPSKISAVQWRFSCSRSQTLGFSATLFRMNPDKDNPMLNLEKVVPSMILDSGEGIVEVPDRGCILLRWSNTEVSSYRFWSGCARRDITLSYSVKRVTKQDEPVAASALGLLMLRNESTSTAKEML